MRGTAAVEGTFFAAAVHNVMRSGYIKQILKDIKIL
jgi:hypothetical protein